MGNTYNLVFHHDVTPDPYEQPKFDPLFGFKEPRKEKVMIATEEEMDSAQLDPSYRDYCAHLFIDFLACRAEKMPFVYKCHHQLENWHHCLYEEKIDAMKDYERERRLLMRQKRIEEKQKKLGISE